VSTRHFNRDGGGLATRATLAELERNGSPRFSRPGNLLIREGSARCDCGGVQRVSGNMELPTHRTLAALFWYKFILFFLNGSKNVSFKSGIVTKFRDLCVWLHETWLLRKYLFDKNPDLSILQQPCNEHFFCRLHTILQEYWLIQLAKLHNPAVQNNRVNLTLDYIIEYGNWDAETLRELKQLQKTMTALIPSLDDHDR
jgi:hypothetical protein